METDIPLKVLARRHPQDLLRLVGDPGVAVSAGVLELQDIRRSVDCVIEVRQGDETYFRHFEFQAAHDPDMARRCFRYNTQLTLQLVAPVITSVVYVLPPGPPERDLVFRLVAAGREVNTWRFESVRLWEIDARDALASEAPGLLALVPLMLGGSTAEAIVSADREISRLSPGEAGEDAAAILLLLAGHRYNVQELARLVGRRKMIQSSVWEAALAEGKAEGALQALREFCREQVRKHHPAMFPEAASLIEGCTDVDRLKAWVIEASDHDDAGFARLLGLG